jgi:uncharacterized membrane protein (DUF2068 family)
LAQRKRKRGRRRKPAAAPAAAAVGAGKAPARRPSRSEQRDAAVRATLRPLAPGERPWPIIVGAVLATLSGVVQLILFLAGVKLKSSGLRASAGQTIVFAVLMLICAAGMWQMRYWAVLGFMALLAILILFAVGSLVKASSVLGVMISLAIVLAGGYLFFKLVRVLSRIQMPKYPGN